MKSTHCALVVLLSVAAARADNWPSWRGPRGDGVSREKSIPLKWSPTENIRWKTALPERGNSSPIVWGGKVFITQALSAVGQRMLICFDRATGRELWRKGVTIPEKEETHPTNDYAAASPVTDGERVIAFFGTAGLFCYDMEGRELWKRDLGRQTHEWGYAVSPILHGDVCVLFFGPGKRSFLTALDKKTGKTVWTAEPPPLEKRARTDGFKGQEAKGIVCTYGTPIVVQAGAREEIVMAWPQQARAYEPKTGRELWRCDGLNELVYCSPVAADGVVVAMGGFFGTSIAVRAGGSGDVTATHRLWQHVRTVNRLGTGVIRDGRVYILNTSRAQAECIELKTGRQVWSNELKVLGGTRDSWSSMVLAGDVILCLTQAGDTLLLRASPTFESLGVNSLGNEHTNSSTAVSDGELFVRTHKNLWCISEKK